MIYKALALLIGTIIGAGVLGLPYAFAQAGYLPSSLILLLVYIIVLLDFLLIGELTIEGPPKHQIVGLAKYYIGSTGKKIVQILIAFAVWGAMLAYAIGSTDILLSFFPQITDFRLVISAIYILVLSIPVYLGLKTTAKIEGPLVAALVGILLTLSIAALNKFDLANLQTVNLSKISYPYGVLLFALGGSIVVPEVSRILKRNRSLLKKVLACGVSIPTILYFLFSTITLGVAGEKISEVATISFAQLVHPLTALAGNIFALLAMSTSFIALGLVLRDSLVQDYNLKLNYAYIITFAVPLLLLIFADNFIRVLEITGALVAGALGIMTGLMALRARKISRKKGLKNTIAPYVLIITFLIGIILTIFEILEFGL